MRLFSVLIIFSAFFCQDFKPLLDDKLRDLLHEELSGELAKDHVIQITRNNRIQGSRGYRNAANYVLSQLRSFGFSEKDAFIESYKSDGKVVYQTWQSPSGWHIESAELRLVEPVDERIVSYPEIGMSLITYSNPGDVTAELVWVGRGTSDNDYEGKDVKGKIVLATGYGGSVHRLAVLKYGAKAVVCYLDDERAMEYPDMLQYTGMWPRSEELDRVTFGFNLTNRQGERLKNLILSGKKVVVRAKAVGPGLESYFMDLPVAVIHGTDKAQEELVFSAHLDHPKESANDNASGSSAILDMARSLKTLIDSKRIPRPRRTIRFIWVPEWYGTMAYTDAHEELKGPDLGGKFLANINMDMVGENLEILHSSLVITHTPNSIPSVLNDVVTNMAEMVDRMDVRTPRGSLSRMNYRITPYSGGSDHMNFIDRKIPAMMFSHDPDYTHHTSEDTPDKVDPVELERCEIIATASILYLANLDDKQALDLAYLSNENALKMLGNALRKSSKLDGYERYNILKQYADLIDKKLGSVLNFNNSGVVREQVELFKSLHKKQIETLSKDILRQVAKSDDRVPVRLTRGPLDFGLPMSKLSGSDLDFYGSKQFNLNGTHRFELVNFIDGKRTVSQIRDALSAEFHPFDLTVIARYIEDLIKVDVIKWK
ncbi:MAG: DUF4910 domain-containing protein [Calditrichaeota bacterium]|nr:DUF4910 domain-containing protein [Calditrichota bacterium]